MLTDTELLTRVFMFLGILGAVIFVPWMIYRGKKKLPLKYQRIGCLVSAVLLLCGMYFALNNSPLTTKKFSRETFVRVMEPGVAEWVGENNYSVNLDGEVVTFIVWNAGASAVFNRLYQGLDENSDNGWASEVDGIQKSAKNLQELVEQYCFEEMTVMVNAVDYSDHSKLLISCSPDAVLFNAADSIEERVKPEVVEAEPESNDLTTATDTDKQEIIPTPTDNVEPALEMAPESATTSEPETASEPVVIKTNAQIIERALLAIIPQHYQSDSMFFTNVYVNDDNTVEFMIQLDQNTDDKDAALSLAVYYWGVTKQIAEDSGGEIARYDMMILNNGSPVGDYITEDGITYSVIADGKVKKIQAS